MITNPPLEDPAFFPEHVPVNGQPPAIVAKWGPKSQIRWFRRFPGLILPHAVWDQFHSSSSEHKGLCCDSCADDEEWYGEPQFDDHCCCRGSRAANSPPTP